MKWIGRVVLLVVAFNSVGIAYSQGTFSNLGFEEANLPYLPPGQYGGQVSASDALPGWTIYMEYGYVLHNNETLDSPCVSILSTSYNYSPSGFALGNYFVLLKAGYYPGLPPVVPAIAQTGQVPVAANSLRLIAYLNAPVVTFAGNQIPLFPLSTTGNRTFYGADISAFAGRTGELKFTGGQSYFDSIVFSTVGIPEPSSLTLLSIGLVGLLGKGRRRTEI